MQNGDHPAVGGAIAIVIFEHRDARGFLRLLRPGFRHCFCLLRHEAGWLLCDPLKGGLRLDLVPAYGMRALMDHYRGIGRIALAGPGPSGFPAAPLGVRPLTCVEVVKRTLGLAAPAVFTPFQLHAYLISTGKWIL